jgi:hypothetical protein
MRRNASNRAGRFLLGLIVAGSLLPIESGCGGGGAAPGTVVQPSVEHTKRNKEMENFMKTQGAQAK